MPTPSLILVPARFKTGKLYTPVATTSGGVVLGASGDFNVTRATTATRVNASGLVEVVASGIPRLDYYTSGGTAGCPSLLVEPSGSNLAFHSETWASGNNWTLDAVTRVTGSTSAFLAPDGTFTANALSPTSANVFHGLYSNSSTQNTYISGTIYTQSAFFKQGTGVAGRYVQLTYTGGGQFTQNGYANFDLQLGTVAVVSGTSADTNRAARIENYGNGWYRCSFTATCNAAGNGIGVLPVLVNASGNTRAQSFAGVTGDILYGWGAQFETGSIATSYIPTTAAAVTRNADVINLSGAVSGCIGQTQGTIYIECQADVANNDVIFINTAGQNPGNNYVGIFKISTNLYRASVVASGSTISITQSVATSGFIKAALAYKTGDTAFFINGVQVGTTNTTAFTFNGALSAIQFIANSAIGTKPASVRSAALYTTRLTDSELASLTA
jgi:hypothetical protein